ncbi:hypothetical protein AVEN_273624-1 [Araneus ventricosus]|uniref:Uncharacterized protein n=1 Tax=Araneus ventricosus TaxID=182803 RepID=A0A4Y2EIL9_ARAVE|nr:hypothetical protein AVEN_273624-1 [Araneus ventricosus]
MRILICFSSNSIAKNSGGLEEKLHLRTEIQYSPDDVKSESSRPRIHKHHQKELVFISHQEEFVFRISRRTRIQVIRKNSYSEVIRKELVFKSSERTCIQNSIRKNSYSSHQKELVFRSHPGKNSYSEVIERTPYLPLVSKELVFRSHQKELVFISHQKDDSHASFVNSNWNEA